MRVGQLIPSTRDHQGARTIYLAGPGSEAQVRQSPRDFGDAMHTGYALMPEIAEQSLVGDWIVYGDTQDSEAVLEFMRDNGAKVSIEHYPSFPLLFPPGNPVWVACLVLAAAAIGLVASRTRRHAVTRLNGGSSAGGWLRDLFPVIAWWLVAGVATTITVTTWIITRFDGAGLAEVLVQTGYLASLFLASAAAATVCALTAVYRVDLLGALNGKLPARGIIVASGTIRGLAVLFILAGLVQIASLSTKAAAQQKRLDTLSQLGGAYHLAVGKAFSNEDQNVMGKTVRPWLQEHDRAGHLLLAKRVESPVGDLLLVNKQYLQKYQVTLSDGRDALEVASETQATLLIPENRLRDRDAITAESTSTLELEAEPDITLESFTSRPASSVPIFEAGDTAVPLTAQPASSLSNPVIIILPAGHIASYAAISSSRELLILDRDAILRDIDSTPTIARYVLSVTPVELEVTRAATAIERDLHLAIFTTITAACIAVFAGGALAATYCQLRARRIFVRQIHGHRWLGSYLPLWGLELILAAATMSHIPRTLAEQNSQYAAFRHLGDASIPKPGLSWQDIAAPSGVTAVVFATFLATLAACHQRTVSNETLEA